MAQLSEITGYNIQAKDIRLTLRDGLGIQAQDLLAETAGGTEHIVAPELNVVLDLSELIKGRLVPSIIFVSRPQIDLSRLNGLGTQNSKGGSVFKKMLLAGLESVSIEDGSLRIKGFPFDVKDLFFHVYPLQGGVNKIQVRIEGNAVSGTHSTPFKLQGHVSAENMPAGNTFAELTLDTKMLPLEWIPWPKLVTFKNGSGEAHLAIKAFFGGTLSAEGTINAKDVQFSLAKNMHTFNYREDQLQTDFVALYSNRQFEISSIHLKGEDFSLSGGYKLDFRDTSNPNISFEIRSPFLPMEKFKALFPTIYVPGWVKEKIFPILSGGYARLGHFKMNGTREQIRHLKLPQNKEIISMKIDWKDTQVFRDGGALPFEDVAGEMSIEKNTLSTSITRAVFGNSTVEKASLHVNNPYKAPQYTLSVEGQFDLNDLRKQRQLKIMPPEGHEFFERFNAFSGGLSGRLEVGFTQGWNDLKILKGHLNYNGCTFSHEKLCLILVVDEADIRIDGQGKTQFQGKGRWGKSKFQFTGAGDTLWNMDDIKIISQVHIKDILDYFYKGHQFSIKHQGLLPCRATLSVEKRAFSCKGKIDLAGLTVNAGPIALTSTGKKDKAVFDVDLRLGENLSLNDLKLFLGNSVARLGGYWRLKEGTSSDIHVSTERLRLNDLKIHDHDKDILASGAVSGRLRIQSGFGRPQLTSVEGRIKGNNISFTLDSMLSAVKDGNFELEFKGKEALIQSLRMKVGRSPVKIQGRLEGWESLRGTLKIDSDDLDISDFALKETISLDRKEKRNPFLSESHIQLVLNAARGKWQKLAFSSLQAECGLQSGDFLLKAAQVRTEHGRISLKGHWKERKGPERLSFSSEIELAKQPIEDIIDSFNMKSGVKGLLTAKTNLSASGREIKDLASGLSGQGDFSLEQGVVKRKRGVLFKILEVMSLQNIIKGMPDFMKTGYSFKNLEARDVHIKEGIFETEGIVFESPAFNATAQGTFSLPDGMVDFNVWVQTLETLDSLVSWVPIIGYILTEKESSPKGIIIYPYEVKGHWSNPEVKSAVLKNIGPGIVNIFKNILIAPGVIFRWQSTDPKNAPEGVAN